MKALVASALKIKPVMGSTDDGNICQLDQARGMNRALIKLVEQVIEKTPDSAEKVLAHQSLQLSGKSTGAQRGF